MVFVVTFFVIKLPPGDCLSTYISRLEQMGEQLSDEEVGNMLRQYGLDLPRLLRYFKWIGQVIQGDFGFSFDWQQPVRDIIGERLALTFIMAILRAIFTCAHGDSHRHLFRNTSIFAKRLHRFYHRGFWIGFSQFHAGVDIAG